MRGDNVRPVTSLSAMPAIVTTLITETAHAIARAKPPSQNLADAYLSVLLDGLRPAP